MGLKDLFLKNSPNTIHWIDMQASLCSVNSCLFKQWSLNQGGRHKWNLNFTEEFWISCPKQGYSLSIWFRQASSCSVHSSWNLLKPFLRVWGNGTLGFHFYIGIYKKFKQKSLKNHKDKVSHLENGSPHVG